MQQATPSCWGYATCNKQHTCSMARAPVRRVADVRACTGTAWAMADSAPLAYVPAYTAHDTAALRGTPPHDVAPCIRTALHMYSMRACVHVCACTAAQRTATLGLVNGSNCECAERAFCVSGDVGAFRLLPKQPSSAHYDTISLLPAERMSQINSAYLTPSACSAVPPAPLAIACGFALYDEDTTAHGMHKQIQTRTHTACAVSISPSAGRKGAAAGGTASVSVRQQEQALRHRASRQVQPVVARLTTRTQRHMHRHIQTHTHAACAMSFSL